MAAGLAAALVWWLAPHGSDAEGLAGLAAVLVAAAFAFVGGRWLWLKLTYRVGVRLLLSYLLIGLLPFVLFAALSALVGYLLVGQYASRHLTLTLDRATDRLADVTELASERAGAGAIGEAVGLLERTAREGPPGAVWLGPDAAALPVWLPEGRWAGTVIDRGRAWLAVATRTPAAGAAMLVPLDRPVAEWLLADRFLKARFAVSRKAGERQDVDMSLNVAGEDQGASFRVDGRPVDDGQVESGWLEASPSGPRLTDRVGVAWFRLFEDVVRWEDGAPAEGWVVVAIVKTSVSAALDDFLLASEKLGRESGTVLAAIGGFFALIYVLAVSFAVVMIVSIARSTARLTRGSREVGRGNLAWRIAVRRRDQLGDLAVAFNGMAESVQRMVAEVAEKERLSRELELAREIQESLLPAREFRHGGLQVHAHFRPAAEVGGDYFDFFPLAPGRLVLAAGDVAGHGLSTGLLMAMVKSAVAALIHEGHRGRLLLERLNELLLEQPHRHRMVTLALLDIDEQAGRVEVTNTGHPPVLVIRRDCAVEEVALGALPLGHAWRQPPASCELSFPPGSRLVVYSDGLVEAMSPEQEPFGYDRLREAVERHRTLPPSELLAALLADLEAFTAGGALSDDLTILVVAS